MRIIILFIFLATDCSIIYAQTSTNSPCNRTMSFDEIFKIAKTTNKQEILNQLIMSCFSFYDQSDGFEQRFLKKYEIEDNIENITFTHGEIFYIFLDKFDKYHCTEYKQSQRLLQEIKRKTIFTGESLDNEESLIYLLNDSKHKVELINVKGKNNNYTYSFEIKLASPLDWERMKKEKYKDPFLKNLNDISKLQYRYANVFDKINNTGIIIQSGDLLNFEAWGEITLGSFAGRTGPIGINGYTDYSIINQYRHGCLLYRIGTDSWSPVGEELIVTAQSSGQLYLMVNDRETSNNRGDFDVKIKILPVRKQQF